METNMINTKTAFENVGMGFSVAGGWHNGEWVALMATSEGRGQRRTWCVSGDFVRGGKPVRVTITKVACFRYEAADIVLAELVELMAGNAAPAALAA
jgi:hypothetical protein